MLRVVWRESARQDSEQICTCIADRDLVVAARLRRD